MAHLIREEFQRCHSEQTLFTKSEKGGKILIVSVFVDDLIFTGDDEHMMVNFKRSMMREFDMSDLGRMSVFGIKVLQNSNGIYICQRKYALEVLGCFGMEESKAVHSPIVLSYKMYIDEDGDRIDETLYKQIVGNLIYLTATRPDMIFVVSLISRYMSRPIELHMKVAKRTLSYLKG